MANVVGHLSKRLASRGHEVHVATGVHPGCPSKELIAGALVHRFAVEGNHVQGLRGDVEQYRRFVLGGQWDIVVFHAAQSWTLDAILPTLRNIGGACILVGHGLSAFRDPRYANYFSRLRDSLADFREMITLSARLEEAELLSSAGAPAPTIIPNGVDLEEWEQPTLRMRERWRIGDRPWVVNVSNHSPVKGHPWLFRVLGQLAVRHPAARGTIVGSGYPAARWNLGRLGVRGGCFYECRCLGLCVQDSGSASRRPKIERRICHEGGRPLPSYFSSRGNADCPPRVHGGTNSMDRI